jgi:hypothetical protein
MPRSDADRLLALEIKAHAPHLNGCLFVESPANLNDAKLYGETRIGAFAYFNYGVSATNIEIGRFVRSGTKC